MIDEIIDKISETFEYIISFEWLGDTWEFVGGMFSDLSEFSIAGLVFALLSFSVVYLARDYMLKPFLVSMSPASAIFWGGATYVGSIMLGYLVGKQMFSE